MIGQNINFEHNNIEMLRQLVIISLIPISICWPFGMALNRVIDFDPDIDICNDPSITAGVVADDGETYLFKGNYFWRTRPLTKDSGILGYANLTTTKWSEIKAAPKLVFTVPKDNALMTVFVMNTKWFAYQKGTKVLEGTFDSWPDFKDLKVTSAFSPIFAGTLVYILYSDNNYYTLYDFTNILKPVKVRSGQTTIRENYLLFTEDDSKAMPGTSIRTLINIRAGLTYKSKLFLVSRETYCAITLSADSFERECIPKENDLLGCPLDIKLRPVTKMAETTKDTATSAALVATTSISEESNLNVTDLEPIPPNWDFNDSISESGGQIRTGIPILGRELEDEDQSEGNQTLKIGAGVEKNENNIHEKNKQNSLIWFIVFIVAMVGISVFAILMVGIVARIKNKKRHKGNNYFTK